MRCGFSTRPWRCCPVRTARVARGFARSEGARSSTLETSPRAARSSIGFLQTSRAATQLGALCSRARAAFWLEESEQLSALAETATELAEGSGDREMLGPALS